MLMLVPNKTTKVRKSPPLPLVPSLSKKTVVPKPSKIVARLKEGKLTGGYPEPVRSTQDMNTKELPPRPSCVPRARTYRSRVGVMMAAKEKQDVTVKVSTTGPRNPVMARQKVSVNIGTSRAAGCVKVTETFVEKAMVAGTYRTGAPTTNRWLTTRKTFAYPHAVEPAVHIALSRPGSPDLSSFPSQSWITIDVDVKQNKGPTQICGNETLSSMDDVPNPGVAGTAKGSCGSSEPESVSSSPTSSPSPTFVETTESLSGPIIGLDGTVKISTPTKKPSNKVSHTVCAATIISRSGTGTSKGQTHEGDGQKPPPSPTKISDTMNRTRMMVRGAVEIARDFFSPSRRKLRSGPETTTFKSGGTNVSRIRKLFIPPLDKDAKVSKNPTTQNENEMPRARQVASDSVAIVTKVRTSSSDSPGRV
ncbi:hypothetical protein J3R82DRAFT_3685 [Butyriboletus roseoflavus]|nr:hypothetical protein J3R82DRAFT_3685 [Butyriboletus roseoflavus]